MAILGTFAPPIGAGARLQAHHCEQLGEQKVLFAKGVGLMKTYESIFETMKKVVLPI